MWKYFTWYIRKSRYSEVIYCECAPKTYWQLVVSMFAWTVNKRRPGGWDQWYPIHQFIFPLQTFTYACVCVCVNVFTCCYQIIKLKHWGGSIYSLLLCASSIASCFTMRKAIWIAHISSCNVVIVRMCENFRKIWKISLMIKKSEFQSLSFLNTVMKECFIIVTRLLNLLKWMTFFCENIGC